MRIARSHPPARIAAASAAGPRTLLGVPRASSSSRLLARLPDRQVPRSAPPRPAFGAKAVGALVPAVTRSAFQRFGFSTASLLTEWSAIIGPDLARIAVPERVRWPRPDRGRTDDDDEQSGGAARDGAVIVLRVDGPRALEVQYRTQLIKDRINAYFGYAAISTVRILQAPHARERSGQVKAAGHGREVRPGSGLGALPAPPDLSAIPSDDLRLALSRLHAGVARAGLISNGTT